jgi:hypothetical protein
VPPRIALAVVLLLSSPAAAQRDVLRADLDAYFAGEKSQSWVFLGTGLAGLGTAVGLYVEGSDLARGASYPIAVFGLGQAVVGAGLAWRTDAQVARLQAQLVADPGALKAAELKRMRRVNLQFDILMIAELVFVVGGTATFFLARREDADTLAGVGLGLASEGAVTLVLDWFAARRADRYTESLLRFTF